MAKRGDVIEHPVTGERITFLETSKETNGEYALLDLHVKPHGFVAAPHVHPRLQETFEIRKGTFTFVIDGEKREVGPGEGATVPAGAPPRLVELG
jgi:mannose-6-phosphate isomerase-like protein (cupin superfamily)